MIISLMKNNCRWGPPQMSSGRGRARQSPADCRLLPCWGRSRAAGQHPSHLHNLPAPGCPHICRTSLRSRPTKPDHKPFLAQGMRGCWQIWHKSNSSQFNETWILLGDFNNETANKTGFETKQISFVSSLSHQVWFLSLSLLLVLSRSRAHLSPHCLSLSRNWPQSFPVFEWWDKL